MSRVKVNRQQLQEFIKDSRTLRAFELLIDASNGLIDIAFIVKTPTDLLSSAQAISELDTGLMKVTAGTGDITSQVIEGTDSQIIIVETADKITISTPQDIATDSSPTFVDMNLTGDLKLESGNAVKINDVECLTGQASYEANASAVSAISVVSGIDTIDISSLNTSLSTLVSEINALKDKINNIISKNESISIYASS